MIRKKNKGYLDKILDKKYLYKEYCIARKIK